MDWQKSLRASWLRHHKEPASSTSPVPRPVAWTSAWTHAVRSLLAGPLGDGPERRNFVLTFIVFRLSSGTSAFGSPEVDFVGFLPHRLPPGDAGHRRLGQARGDLPRPAFFGPCAADHRLRLHVLRQSMLERGSSFPVEASVPVGAGGWRLRNGPTAG